MSISSIASKSISEGVSTLTIGNEKVIGPDLVKAEAKEPGTQRVDSMSTAQASGNGTPGNTPNITNPVQQGIRKSYLQEYVDQAEERIIRYAEEMLRTYFEPRTGNSVTQIPNNNSFLGTDGNSYSDSDD